MASDEKRVKRVAVVGAGISGVCSAAHLLRLGLDVTLFERSSIAGGVWHHDSRTAREPDYTKQNPSLGDYARRIPLGGSYLTPPSTPPRDDRQKESRPAASDEELEIAHAPPGPTYDGLKNNVALPLMKTTLADWPAGLDDYVSQQHLETYIQEISRTTGVHAITEYSTRVEEIRRSSLATPWLVYTVTLDKSKSGYAFSEGTWQFDAIVVASGHYNMPRIPDIPGLLEWKARFPDRVMHSKGYREPSPFKDRTLLVIGAGASSTDVVKEATPIAKAVYQSSRGGAFDVPARALPEGAIRVDGVKGFHIHDDAPQGQLASHQSIPGHVELENGQLLNIDNLILGTGYITSYPFLPQLHDDETAAEDATRNILVTKEGNMAHNLHKDLFWISDPSLAFVGVPYHISTFSFFEFQAQIVARVFAGLAKLPSEADMRKTYLERLSLRGVGRDFHSMRGEGDELAYVADLVEWANRDGQEVGAPEMQGHTAIFLEGHRRQREMLKQLGLRLERRNLEAK
jgi:cation diffusion facilitator CzcD-associated flavoprotein CzcO